MVELNNKFTKIKEARLLKGVSIRFLEKSTKISYETIRGIENDISTNRKNAESLLKSLNIPLEDFDKYFRAVRYEAII